MSVPANSPHFPRALKRGKTPVSDAEVINSCFIRIPVKSLPANVHINEDIAKLKWGYCSFCKACLQTAAAKEASLGREKILSSTDLFDLSGITAQKLKKILASSKKLNTPLENAFSPNTLLDRANHLYEHHHPEECSRVPAHARGTAISCRNDANGDIDFGYEVANWKQAGNGNPINLRDLKKETWETFEAADLEILNATGKDGSLLQRSHFFGNSLEGQPDSATYGCRRMNGNKPCSFRMDLNGREGTRGRVS